MLNFDDDLCIDVPCLFPALAPPPGQSHHQHYLQHQKMESLTECDGPVREQSVTKMIKSATQCLQNLLKALNQHIELLCNKDMTAY